MYANAVQYLWPLVPQRLASRLPGRVNAPLSVSLSARTEQSRVRSVTCHIEEAIMGNTRALAASIVALTVIVFGRPSPALADDAELVIEWNHALFSVGLPGGPAASHPAAILHIAMSRR
jgi:hypothetical protein